MTYDLLELRTKLGLSRQEMAQRIGIHVTYYSAYEKEGEIPSKYIYALWEEDNSISLPEDFFVYTSANLKVNMAVHGINQTQVAKMFGFENQSTISSFLKDNIPMYELREKFYQFNPLIVGAVVEGGIETPKKKLHYITTLKKRGNFIRTEKLRQGRLEKGNNIYNQNNIC